MTKLRSTLLASAVGLAVCGMAGQAHATAYAFGNIIFTNLQLSGLAANGVSLSNPNVATSDSSNYPGAAASGFSGGPTNPGSPLTGGSEVQQATSGTGPFPAENTFTQALTSGSGTRGDAVLTGNLITGQNTGASDVAEGRLTVPGSAASTSGTSTGFSVNVSVGATTTFTLSFNASDLLTASITAPGEFASAQVNAAFSIQGINGTNFSQVTYSPDTLNTTVTASSIGTPSSFSTASTPYSFTQTLAAGNYQFSLLSGAQERLLAPTPTPVPEPITLSILGSGLVLVGALRRRR